MYISNQMIKTHIHLLNKHDSIVVVSLKKLMGPGKDHSNVPCFKRFVSKCPHWSLVFQHRDISLVSVEMAFFPNIPLYPLVEVRSQTSENMDRWKSTARKKHSHGEIQKGEDKRWRRLEMEKVRREKMQVREKVGKSRNTVFFPVVCLRRVEK